MVKALGILALILAGFWLAIEVVWSFGTRSGPVPVP